MLRLFAYLWAAPATCLGLAGVLAARLTGGKVQIVDGVIEACGGVVTTLLEKAPIIGGAAAMTLGHVILGLDEYQLNRCRTHEHVHVRQYERWGPLFIPAYLLASAILWLRGRDSYYENPFEREAYETH